MLFSYIHYVIPPMLFASSAGTLIFTLYYREPRNLSGLSATTMADSLATLFSGIVMTICMLKSEKTCDSTDTFLAYTITFFPLMSGFISQVSWIYQCCCEMKSCSKRSTEKKSKNMNILFNNIITILMLLPLLVMKPQEVIERNKRDNALCSPNPMLSSTNVEKCKKIKFHNIEILNKFLADLNKSRNEFMYSSYKKTLLNDTEDIVQKIYQLVRERVNTLGNNQSEIFAKRKPREFDNNNISNSSMNHLSGRGNSSITQADMKETVVYQNLSFTEMKPYEDNNTLVHIKRFKHMIRNCTKLELDNMNNTNHHTSDSEGGLFQNDRLSTSTINMDFPTSKPNKTSDINFVFNEKEGNETETYCYTMCVLKKDNEKAYLMFLLLISFLIPLVVAIILYNKASILKLSANDNKDAKKNQILQDTSKRMIIISILLLLPNFVNIFLDSMLCTLLPGWLNTVLFMATQVHPIIRNALDVTGIKSCAKCKSSAKVQPLEEEANTESTVNQLKAENPG